MPRDSLEHVFFPHQPFLFLSRFVSPSFPSSYLSSASFSTLNIMSRELGKLLVYLLPSLILVWKTGAGEFEIEDLLFGRVLRAPPRRSLEANGIRSWLAKGEEEDWKEEILRLAMTPEAVEWVKGLRRRIHEHPELAYEEVETGKLIKAELDSMGIDYRFPLARTGILATIGTGGPPVVALRADMDALPIQVCLSLRKTPFLINFSGGV